MCLKIAVEIETGPQKMSFFGTAVEFFLQLLLKQLKYSESVR